MQPAEFMSYAVYAIVNDIHVIILSMYGFVRAELIV